MYYVIYYLLVIDLFILFIDQLTRFDLIYIFSEIDVVVTYVNMSLYDASTCELLDEDCICLKGFNIYFSWDYPDNWCLKDVQENVFHIYDATDNSK